MKSNFNVERILNQSEYVEWLLKKHYAHRVPSISYAYGLYNDNKLCGICTFGMIANYIEMEAWKPFNILELNRLCVESEEANITSWFISRCFLLLPHPVVLISYADFDMGHLGKIYQATNWIYTGVGGQGSNIFMLKNGETKHQRHSKDINPNDVKEVKKASGKARYYYFIGNKKEKKEMSKMLRFPVVDYPKGNTKRYDASYQPISQGILF